MLIISATIHWRTLKESEFWPCPSQNFKGSHFRQDKIQTPLDYQGSFPTRLSARLSADPRAFGLRLPLRMDPRLDPHRSAVSRYYNVPWQDKKKCFGWLGFSSYFKNMNRLDLCRGERPRGAGAGPGLARSASHIRPRASLWLCPLPTWRRESSVPARLAHTQCGRGRGVVS